MLQDAVCAVMQGMVTEDVTMCHWMSIDSVGCSDAWLMVLPVAMGCL